MSGRRARRSARACTRAMAQHGPLCVGHRPAPGPAGRVGADRRRSQGLETFAMTCVEAFAGTVAVVKPQSAFFERLRLGRGGGPGARRSAGLREAGTLSLLDVKRGDIGSTMTAYAEAYLGRRQPAARPTRSRSARTSASARCARRSTSPRTTGRGVFVLALTSNPEGASVQHARRGDGRASPAPSWPAPPPTTRAPRRSAASGSSSAPRSVGGPRPRARPGRGQRPLLAPGFGAQGAGAEDLRASSVRRCRRCWPAAAARCSARAPTRRPSRAARSPPAGWRGHRRALTGHDGRLSSPTRARHALERLGGRPVSGRGW